MRIRLPLRRGTFILGSGRRFFSSGFRAWKTLAQFQQLLPVFPRHSSVSLNFFGALAPLPSEEIPESVVRVGGQGTLGDLDPPLRGYPLGHFETRRALIGQAEYRLPLAQIFRGFGTIPLFLQNLGVFGFYDAAKLQRQSDDRYSQLIDGVGGGLIFNSVIGYNLPFSAKLEFAHGLKRNLNGQDVFSFGLNF